MLRKKQSSLETYRIGHVFPGRLQGFRVPSQLERPDLAMLTSGYGEQAVIPLPSQQMQCSFLLLSVELRCVRAEDKD